MYKDELHLSEVERQRIRAEEIFRDEIQQKIRRVVPPKSNTSKFFSALNKPLALWFLSSVLLTGIGWAYTKWDETRTVREQNRIEVMQLDIEIYGRLMKSARRLGSARNTVGLRESIEILDKSSGVFPELENRSFEGILLILTWLVPEEEKADLENARAAYHELQKYRSSTTEEAADAIVLVKRKYLDKSFAIRQWRVIP